MPSPQSPPSSLSPVLSNLTFHHTKQYITMACLHYGYVTWGACVYINRKAKQFMYCILKNNMSCDEMSFVVGLGR